MRKAVKIKQNLPVTGLEKQLKAMRKAVKIKQNLPVMGVAKQLKA